MKNSDKILNFLKENRSWYCDDHLSSETKITPRSSVYADCNSLATEKKILRSKGFCFLCDNNKKKYVNSYIPVNPILNEHSSTADEVNEPVNGDISVNSIPDQYSPPVDSEFSKDKPWHWEGNIQIMLVKYLQQQGIVVSGTANTADREQGKDIVAKTQSGAPLWITVKGFPEDKGRTKPTVQARHWFSQAIFDIIRYRGQSEDANLAIGLPDGYPTYVNLAKASTWFLKVSKTKIFWVSESGRVRETQ